MACINLQNGRLFGTKNVFLSSIELTLLITSNSHFMGIVIWELSSIKIIQYVLIG